jgi:hypothetical protein
MDRIDALRATWAYSALYKVRGVLRVISYSISRCFSVITRGVPDLGKEELP